MKEPIKSPESIGSAFLKGAGWLGVAVGIPLIGTAEVMAFKGARSTAEFWQDNLWLGSTGIGLLLIGGSFNAIRAALYKAAYDAVK